jgi:hypothetical protein
MLPGSSRLLAVAWRLLLAFLALPLAGADAHHAGSTTAASMADGPRGDVPAPGDPVPAADTCHHLGACHPFVAAAAPHLERTRLPLENRPAVVAEPPCAVAPRLFRPPRAGFRA